MNTLLKSKIANQKSKTLRPPSPRDLEIYERACLANQSQRELAAEYGIHYTRISQIVRNVECWLAAGGSPTQPKFKNVLIQRRLKNSIHKLRLLRAVKLAAAALEAPPQPATKTRRRIVAGEEVWREETHAAAAPVNLYALQNYVLAAKALADFEQTQEKDPTPDEFLPPKTLQELVSALCRFRNDAVAAGLVANTYDPRGFVIATLQHLLGPIPFKEFTPPSAARLEFAQQLSAAFEEPLAATPATPETSDVDDHQAQAEGAGELSAAPIQLLAH